MTYFDVAVSWVLGAGVGLILAFGVLPSPTSVPLDARPIKGYVITTPDGGTYRARAIASARPEQASFTDYDGHNITVHGTFTIVEIR